MRVIVPYTSISDDAEEALRRFAPDAERVDVSGSDTSYAELFCDLWAAGEDFVLIEHDIVIGAETLPAFDRCEQSWCRTLWLQCVRFRSELMSAAPELASELRGLHWTKLDGSVTDALRAHTPDVRPHMHAVTAADDPGRLPRLIARARDWERLADDQDVLAPLYLVMALYYAADWTALMEAIALLRRLLDAEAETLKERGYLPEAFRWLSRMEIETGQLDEALLCAEAALDVDAHQPLARLTQAEAYYMIAGQVGAQERARALDELLAILEPLVELNVETVEAYGGVGGDQWRPRWYSALAAAELGRYGDARELAGPLLDVHPSTPSVLEAQAEIRAAIDRWAEEQPHVARTLVPARLTVEVPV